MITFSTSNDNPTLKTAIAARIKSEGRITFADFMEMALYYPDEGYYTNRRGLIGARGDFYTAPHLTPLFGELLARQFAEMWERLGHPEPFTLVEMGAGQGLLAGDILSQLYQNKPEIWPTLEYRIVEISEKLREAQAHRLLKIPKGAALLDKVSWNSWGDFEAESINGCFFSNELVDAFPVHLVTIQNGQLQEIYVGLDEQENFIEEVGPLSTPALDEYFQRLGIDIGSYEDGYRTEVNLRSLEWLEQIAITLNRGYVVTIDYGYEAASRYHPKRSSGTLQSYYQHQVHTNPYLNLGQQDITTHVDFSTLALVGEGKGLKSLGLPKQAEFLGGLGIAEMFTRLTSPDYAQNYSPADLLQQREALLRLINPAAMGNFQVLVQAKNVLTEPKLQGLSLML